MKESVDPKSQTEEEIDLFGDDSLDRDPTIAELTDDSLEPAVKKTRFGKVTRVAGKAKKSILITSAVAVYVVLFSLSSGVVKLQTPGNGDQKVSASSGLDYSPTSIPGSDLNVQNPAESATYKKIAVNGELKVSNGLVLAPTSKPEKPVQGSIYLDATTKRLNYFDGTKYIELGAGSPVVTNVTNLTNLTNLTNVNNVDNSVTNVDNSTISNVTVTNITNLDQTINNITNTINELPDLSGYAAMLERVAFKDAPNQVFTGSNKFASTLLLQNTVNSSNAFQVQNAAGNSLLKINTLNSDVAIGNTSDAITQTINIGTNTNAGSTTTINIGSDQGASQTAIKSGTGGTSLDTTGNTSVNSTGNTTVGSGGNTTVNSGGDTTVNSTNGTKINSGSSGTTVAGTNSETAFSVQNSVGDNRLVVDTVNDTVNIKGNLQIVPLVGTQVGGFINSVETPLELGSNIFGKKRDIVVTNNDQDVLPKDYEVSVTLDAATSAEVKAQTRSDQNDFRLSYGGIEISRNIITYTDSNITFKFILKANIFPGDSDTYAIYYQSAGINTPGPNYALQLLDSIDSPWTSSAAQLLTVADTVVKKQGTGSMRMTAIAAQVASPTALNQGVLPQTLVNFGAVNTTVAGNQYVYTIGGYTRDNTGSGAAQTLVTRSTISGGNISSPSSSGQGQLSTARYAHKTILSTTGLSKYIYVVGGNDGAGYKAEVYKALIDSSTGNVGSFSLVSNLPKAIGYEEAFIETISGVQYMYVMGGYSVDGAENVIYRATVDGSGNVGAFSSIGFLPTALSEFAAINATAGGLKNVYILGGKDGGGARSANVYRAVIDGGGNVGSFNTVGQGQLPAGRSAFTASLATVGGGQQIFVAGGNDGTNRLNTLLQASIDNSGNITTFTTQEQGTLPSVVDNHAAVITTSGSNVYLNTLGGDVSSSQSGGDCIPFTLAPRPSSKGIFAVGGGGPICNGYTPIVIVNASTTAINHGTLTNVSTYNASKTTTPIDLSNFPQLRFWVSSSRAGSYMSIELSGDNGANWYSYPFTVDSSNSWEEKTVLVDAQNLSNVTDYRIRVTDTSINFSGFLDDLRAGNEFAVTFAGTPPTITASNAIGASSNLTINSTGSGKVVIQYATGGTGGFTVYDGGTFPYFDISKEGDLLSRRKVDSTTSLQIQNAAGATLFTANTKKMEIIINGHIVTAGNTPTTTPNSNAGLGGTCSVSGNDTAGTVTIITGSALWQSGTQCTITFVNAFGVAPRTTITPTSGSTSARQPYVSSTTTNMTIKFNVADTASNTHTFNYFNPQ